MDGFLNAMLAVNVFFQSLGSWLEIPMKAFTFLGSEEFYLLFGPAIYWCLDTGIGLHVALFLNISIPINAAFKFAFHGPRPFWISSNVTALASESSFGVPSGHSMNSASIFGGMAWLARKAWAFWVAGILVVLIGLSRIYLGMHFLHDVLLGWALGLALIWLLFTLEPGVLGWLKKQSFGAQVSAAFGASLLLLVPAVIMRMLSSGWTMPADWAQNALQALPDLELAPLSLEGALSSVGAFFGLAFGALWTQQRGGFTADGQVWQRLARYLLGVVVIFALWRGLGLLQPDGETLVAFSIRYVRYAITGFWITGLAPLVFKQLKI